MILAGTLWPECSPDIAMNTSLLGTYVAQGIAAACPPWRSAEACCCCSTGCRTCSAGPPSWPASSRQTARSCGTWTSPSRVEVRRRARQRAARAGRDRAPAGCSTDAEMISSGRPLGAAAHDRRHRWRPSGRRRRGDRLPAVLAGARPPGGQIGHGSAVRPALHRLRRERDRRTRPQELSSRRRWGSGYRHARSR